MGGGDIDDRREFNLIRTLLAGLDIWYKADRFALYMGIAPERYHVSYA